MSTLATFIYIVLEVLGMTMIEEKEKKESKLEKK